MQHQQHRLIAESFHTRHVPASNLVLILNADSYVMAEHSLVTRRTVWQRLVNVTQREKVEKWLAEAYPATPQGTVAVARKK